jgi:GNAT superfamily N-acetyltransferase
VSEGDLVRGLQERAARGQPAEHIEVVDGWWLRHSPGCAWWISTVLPHGRADGVVAGIERAEAFYADRGMATHIQISPGAGPAKLDDLLAERGYELMSPVSMPVASAADVMANAPVDPVAVRVDGSPSPAWFETWRAVTGGDTSAERALLNRIEGPAAYASVPAGDTAVAVGRAVVETGWAGIFAMAARPGARGTGAARAVLAALARWAAGTGADHLYLQVEPDNAAAIRLYERMGFRELCAYHYRSRAAP